MKIHIMTLGCPKNEYDSECLGGNLASEGFTFTEDPGKADAIIVNTCGFIQDAKKESIEAIFDMARQKKEDAVLVVSGCLSQRYGEDLFEELPEAAVIVGVNDYGRLPGLIRDARYGNRIKALSGQGEFHNELHRRASGFRHTATLKIAEGCDNCCTYCVIPSIRGSFRSRLPQDLMEEAKWLAAQGCRELILIAQDVTAYGQDLPGSGGLPGLLRSLCEIEGIQWIRLMYCYEDRITDDLIAVMASEPKICHYVDIPLQHISPSILSAMHRRSTPESIRNTLSRLRAAIPDIHIRTTFIVGFPGETKEDFQMLRNFMEEQGFDRAGVFAYSKEEGTPAAEMPGQVPERTKFRRKEILMLDQLERSRKANRILVGKELEVLIDGTEELPQRPEEPTLYIGRTQWDAPEIDQNVIFQSYQQHMPGDIVKVSVIDAFDYDLTGVEVQ